MTDLSTLARSRHTDKGPAGHNYTEYYERHFAPMREKAFDLLEIGTQTGESLLLWEDYFPNARIVGVDIAPIIEVNTERVSTVVCDIKDYRPDRAFSIVIDDGSHDPRDVVEALNELWKVLAPGGWYAIEDMHCKGLATLLDDHIDALFLDVNTSVAEMHIYPKLAVLRKLP